MPTDYYPIGKTRGIDLPYNAVAARIRVQRFIFIPFAGWYWSEIFRQEFSPQAKLCFDIGVQLLSPDGLQWIVNYKNRHKIFMYL